MKNNIKICWVSNMQTFTAKIYFTIFLLQATQLALAQFTDDFSDNDFLNFPTWTGDGSRFVVSEQELKLDAPHEDGTAFLSTPSQAALNASWEFKVKMEFNPSASNYSRVYLMSDRADLSGPLNGYFVLIGDNKNEVSLYRQNEMTTAKIIDGRDGLLDLATIELTIRVHRDRDNGWQLSTDLGSSGNFFVEGSSDDDTFAASMYFGVLCSYTATRSDKFTFDDFNIQGGILKDDTAPSLVNLEIKSSQELHLTFSESLNSADATTTGNYTVSPAVGNPINASVLSDQKTVILTFEKSFLENSPYVITITGITDVSGNLMEALNTEFIFSSPGQPYPKAIIITEIFADPSPLVGLPESEFVEIYNRSEHSYNLSGWKLTDQNSVVTLPDFALHPLDYVVLAPAGSVFPGVEKVLQLPNFPSLNNAADVLILRTSDNVTIDSVNYSDSWYKDEDKRNGGWTLEIIDPSNICSEYQNWSASENDLGGTPGSQNSVFVNKRDLTGPTLVAAVPLNPLLLQLQFDEKLEKPLSQHLSLNITPSLAIRNVEFSGPSLTSLEISLEQEIQPGVAYSIVTENLYDCAGNSVQAGKDIAEFGLPEEADSLDVLINEILFNPRPTGVDFLELANNSSKFINLRNWSLAAMDEDGMLKNKTPLTSGDLLFKPGAILAIAEDPNILLGEYFTQQQQNLLQADRLPPFNDDHGSVALVDPSGNVIDYLIYSKDMHSIFIKDDEGVSLERIAFTNASQTQNWKSASSSVGFATPGYVNSNAIQQSTQSQHVKVDPEIFNPFGQQLTFALIHYNFEQGGFVANVKIFDSQGHQNKELANNDVVGTAGFYRWDGDRDDGTRAGVGYYMVWFEIFDDRGSVQNFRARVAIAASF